MSTDECNYKHTHIQCDYCKSNEHVVQDQFHAETYCTKCGAVIIDTRLPRLTLILEKQREQELFLRNLWKHKRK